MTDDIEKVKLSGNDHNGFNPKCPYCGCEFYEWADGKTKDREKIQCAQCGKTYFCVTTPYKGGYEHRVKKLGRPSGGKCCIPDVDKNVEPFVMSQGVFLEEFHDLEAHEIMDIMMEDYPQGIKVVF